MKRLEQLPRIVDETLDGLKADEAMKQRILRSSREQKERPVRRAFSPARVAAVACACVLAVGAGLWAGLAPKGTVQQPDAPSVHSMTAGETEQAADTAPEEDASALQAKGSISIGSKSAASAGSIWASGKNAFPMIGIEGRYYRMLTEPAEVSSSVLGKTLGTVAEYTDEPALASQDVIMSNVAASGTKVRAVGSMSGALIAAEVDGVLRVFQRVSFNGSALRGGEKLDDTLQASGHIARMELSGVGAVEGKSACEALYSAILASASYESSGSLSGKQTLLITLENGISLQLLVKNDRVAACGVWSCPGLTDAFKAALQ